MTLDKTKTLEYIANEVMYKKPNSDISEIIDSKEDVQKLVNQLCEHFWVATKIDVHENIKDVPDIYMQLHLLSNWIKAIKNNYEKEN